MTPIAPSPHSSRVALVPVALVAGLLLASIVTWDVLRAAFLFLLWTWVLGSLVLRLVLPGGSVSGMRGWATATVTGLAGGIMTWLLLSALRIPLDSWSVGLAMALGLTVLALATGWRPAHLKPGLHEVSRRTRDIDPRRLRGPALVLVAVASIAALVAAASHGLTSTKTANPSTSIAFARPPDGQAVTSRAPAGSVSTLWVKVDRAPGDARTYAVKVTLTGRPAWTAARITPATTSTPVTVPVRFRTPGGCRYQVRVMLTPDGSSTPLYTISAYGGATRAKGCAAKAVAGRATSTTPPRSKG